MIIIGAKCCDVVGICSEFTTLGILARISTDIKGL
jgi:hypothetical protein